MTMTKKILAAAALVALASSAAVAQTDFGSPLGAGAGIGGSVAPLGVPGGVPGGGPTGAGMAGLANARAAMMNAGSNGISVPNPAGGNVTVPQAAAQALAAVLGGNPTAAQRSALVTALSPVPASSANALVSALVLLGASPSAANLGGAIGSYNGAVDAIPAGQNPPPALLAVRQALAAASR